MGQRVPPRILSAALVLLLLASGANRAAGAGHAPAGVGTGRGGRPITGGSTNGNGRIIAILPDGTLREMCTAYTQVTESPFTIADGKSESSVDAASASWAKLDTIRSRGVDAGGIGFSRGLPKRWDVGASLACWSGLGLTTGPVTGEVHPAGFGGGSLKVRHTFFGVDSAGTALGLAATLRVPGSSSSPGTTAFEGTLSLPLSASLPLDFTLGAMAQVGAIEDAEATGHHVRFVESVKLERELAPHLSSWIECVSISDQEPGHPWLGTVNGGVSADLWGHVDLSAGAAAGHSQTANDHGFFGGVGLHL